MNRPNFITAMRFRALADARKHSAVRFTRDLRASRARPKNIVYKGISLVVFEI